MFLLGISAVGQAVWFLLARAAFPSYTGLLAPRKTSVITHPPPRQHLRAARICPGIFSASHTPHFPRGTTSQAAPARRLLAIINLRLLYYVVLPHDPCARLSPASPTESSPSPCSMLRSSMYSHTATVSCSSRCSTKLGVLSSFHLGEIIAAWGHYRGLSVLKGGL